MTLPPSRASPPPPPAALSQYARRSLSPRVDVTPPFT
jgi:hypothetical protein